jgi:hypothetical protein
VTITGYLNPIPFECYVVSLTSFFRFVFLGQVLREHLRIIACFLVSMCFESSIPQNTRVLTLPRFFFSIR